MKKTIRCIHQRCNHGKGNILLILGGDNIFVFHRNPQGSYWEKITVRTPGINTDFNNAAIIQNILTVPHGGKSPSFTGNKILVKCRNSHCERWNEIEIALPGIDFSFENSAMISEDLPVGYHLDVEQAAVVV